MKTTSYFLGLLLVFLSWVPISHAADESVEGFWAGAYTLEGKAVFITTTFSSQSGNVTGTLDKPRQSIYGLQLSNLQQDDVRLQFSLLEEMATFSFSGEVNHGRITGTLKHNSTLGDFYLYRVIHVPQDIYTAYKGRYKFDNGGKIVSFEIKSSGKDPALHYIESSSQIHLYPLTTTTFLSQNFEIIMFGKNKAGDVIGLRSKFGTEPERTATRIE